MIFLFTPFSWAIEIKLIAFLLLFWKVEDFFWFVFNPDFGLKNFKADKIWWHKENWWLVAPRQYFIFIPIGIILYLIS